MKHKPEIGQAGAEVTAIEVTPDMIRAGVDVLQDYDEDFESPSATVRKIFMAMAEAESGGK